MDSRARFQRRTFCLSATAWAVASAFPATARRRIPIEIIKAPSSLGLRPDEKGKIPGTWRAADVYLAHGLAKRLKVRRISSLREFPYSKEAEPGTKLRNGHKIRALNLELAQAVEGSRRTGAFPLVLGGECSNLLGGLLGLLRSGGRGLVHIDGHSDFLQPSVYPPQYPLHSAAGMDLALATGRGERLLTQWPGLKGPLVADADAIQLGERYSDKPFERISLMADTAISQITVQRLRQIGLRHAADEILAMLERRSIGAAWLHIDTDVLDETEMPAVDSPGRPGLGLAELAWLVRFLVGTGRIGGADVAIYDPDLDPDGRHADALVDCLVSSFAGIR